VLLIAQANRFAQGADCAIARRLTGDFRSFLAIAHIRPTGGHDGDSIGWRARALAIADAREFRLKLLFDHSSIIRCKRVLGGKILTRPGGRIIGRMDGNQLSEQAFPKNCRLIGRENGSSGTHTELCAVVNPCRNCCIAG
jgi:hypothetical protein